MKDEKSEIDFRHSVIALLVGGKSSRMGSEKGLVMYQQMPLIKHMLNIVQPFGNKVVIVCNALNYKAYGQFQVPLYLDTVADKGPIGGLLSVFKHENQAEGVLLLPCDMPLLTYAILQQLIQQVKKEDKVVMAQCNQQIHPLVAWYSRSIIPLIEIQIQKGDLGMKRLAKEAKARLVEFNTTDDQCFKNMNYIHELTNG